MKTIIAGSRSLERPSYVVEAVELSGFDITEVVSGTARGVDRIGEQWATTHGKSIKRFPANWDELGQLAGMARNVEMAKYAEALIAVWDGKSNGTKHMIHTAYRYGLKVFVYKPHASE